MEVNKAMTEFNKTAAALAASEAGGNITLVALIYKGHEQYSPNSMYSNALPNLPFNAVAMAVFFVFTIWQLLLYVNFRNSFYGIATTLYLVGQAIGYLGRLLSVSNVSGLTLNNENYFLLQFCSLTISPNFYNAAIYSQYSKVLYTYATTRDKVARLNVFGRRVQSLVLSFMFIASDISCLIIQGIGGGVEGTSLNGNDANGLIIGNHVFIAGLAIQTFSMSFFAVVFTKLCYNIFVRQRLEYLATYNLHERYGISKKYSVEKSFFTPWRWYKIIKAFPLENIDSEVITINTNHMSSYQKKIFETYPFAIFLSFGLAVIRCIYRLIELADGGFGGFLIRHEHYLVALDFVPLALSALIMCFYSEGLVYTKRGLAELNFARRASYRGLGAFKELGVEFRYLFSLKVDESKLESKYQEKLQENRDRESLGLNDTDSPNTFRNSSETPRLDPTSNEYLRKSPDFRNVIVKDIKSPWWKFKKFDKKLDTEELNEFDKEHDAESLLSNRPSMENELNNFDNEAPTSLNKHEHDNYIN